MRSKPPTARPPAATAIRTTRTIRTTGQRRKLCQSRRQTGLAGGAAEAEPGLAARVLRGQLAAQQDHRAQVLDRGREAHLGDQLGAAPGRLEPQAADPEQARREDREGEHRADRRERRVGPVLERQRRQVAEHRRRRGVPAERQVERRPGDQDDADRARHRRCRRRRPQATSAAPRTAIGTAAPKAASEPIHSTALPGKRRKTKLPTTAPKIAPAITAMRSCASAAGRSAVRREIGASSV